MNKKIKKTILAFIIALLTICIGNISYGWSPSTFFPIREGSYTYFCRQKGAALRFFEPEGDWNIESGQSTTNRKDTHTAARDETNSKISEVIGKVVQKFNGLEKNARAYRINGDDGSNYNGDFENEPEIGTLGETFIDTSSQEIVSINSIGQDYFINGKSIQR